MKLDHIGIAVHDLQKAKKVYELLLNQPLDKVIDLPSQHIQTIMVETKNTHIELLQPLGEEGAIAKFLEKKGEGLHHIAFEVENFEETLQSLKNQDIPLIGEPTIGVKGNRIIFIHPKATNGTLIELCEKPPSL
ncbi:MAG: methylmalonyl-CoA epimerase [Caldisericia bacterium]|nr:methylmalonyl-CoA epimerase [Caldisericia bacterium]